MSALDPLQRISVPGRLVLGPTNLFPASLPSPPTLTLNDNPGSGVVTPGLHNVAVSYRFPSGESALGVSAPVTADADTSSVAMTRTYTLPSGSDGLNVYVTTVAAPTVFHVVRSQAGGVLSFNFGQTDAQLVNGAVFPSTPPVTALAAGVYPFGGTPLGFVARAKLVREQVYFPAHSEARGRDAVSMYGGRFRAALAFVLQQYDPDVLKQVWARSTTSPNGFSGASILSVPQVGNTLQPGALVASSPLLLVADDPTLPSTLIYAPLWTLGPKLELDLVLNKPSETGLVVVAGLDANNLDVRIDKLENLSLT